MSTHPHKYPKQYKCCNDTIIGCGLLCCSKCDKFLAEDVLKTEEKAAEKQIIWEKTVDKTVKSINGNWSWASAGLLATACQATIVFNEGGLSPVAKNWIYFIIIFAVGVLVAVAEHSFESPERIAQELQIKVPKKKAALGDKEALKKEKAIIKRASTIQINNDKETAMKRILNFVKIEGNVVLEAMENLFIATLSIVVALALNAAANASFTAILSDTKAQGTAVITAQWIFVVVLATVTCFGTLEMGKYIDKLDIEMYNDLEKNGLENSKAALLKHSTIKRIFKLIEYSMSLVLAWALRDAMKTTILSLYGGSGSSNTVAALWTYTLTATFIVTYINTINQRYYLLYPKEENVGLQFDTDQRKLIGKVLYTNIQIVVGIAWYDVFVESPEALSEEALEKHRVWILWLEALGLMLLSTIVGAYWTKTKLTFKTKKHGPVEAFFDAFDNWFDPNHVLDEGKKKNNDDDDDDDDNGKDKRRYWRESFLVEYLGQFVDLMIFSLGFASGWLISAAVPATLVKSYEGIYNPDEVTDISGDVIWSVWLSFFIALIVSTLISILLSKFVKNVREEKHKIFAKWKKELEEKEKNIEMELKTINDNNNNNNNDDGRLPNMSGNEVEEDSIGLKDDNVSTQIEMR